MRGFTLVELMVTIAVLAVLMALALPSFTPLMERWRVRSASEDLQATLYFARSEAIKRGGGVTVVAGDGGASCAATGWSCGWRVFAPNATVTSDPPLQVTNAPTSVTITLADNTSSTLTVDRWGVITGETGGNSLTFRLVPKDKATTDVAANSVCVGAGGFIKRLTNGTDACFSSP
jgi:type IV fimbrial biogenesis protein FimT